MSSAIANKTQHAADMQLIPGSHKLDCRAVQALEPSPLRNLEINFSWRQLLQVHDLCCSDLAPKSPVRDQGQCVGLYEHLLLLVDI